MAYNMMSQILEIYRASLKVLEAHGSPPGTIYLRIDQAKELGVEFVEGADDAPEGRASDAEPRKKAVQVKFTDFKLAVEGAEYVEDQGQRSESADNEEADQEREGEV